MDLKQRYIRDRGYDVEEEFMDSLRSLDHKIAVKIALYLEENIYDIEPNELTTYILGGVVHVEDNPVTFALEIMKIKHRHLTFTDITLISMDEYLDLILENSYIKSNHDNRTNQTTRSRHRVL